MKKIKNFIKCDYWSVVMVELDLTVKDVTRIIDKIESAKKDMICLKCYYHGIGLFQKAGPVSAEQIIASEDPMIRYLLRKNIIDIANEEYDVDIGFRVLMEDPLRMKKGSSVRIRIDSPDAHQRHGVGTMLENFGDSSTCHNYANVRFDDGHFERYLESDLELAVMPSEQEIEEIRKYNESVLEEAASMSLDSLIDDIESRIISKFESSDKKLKRGFLTSRKKYQLGERVILNEKANTKYNITKKGSSGTVMKKISDDEYLVAFDRITDIDGRVRNMDGRVRKSFEIDIRYMDHVNKRLRKGDRMYEISGGIRNIVSSMVCSGAMKIDLENIISENVTAALVRQGILFNVGNGVYAVNRNNDSQILAPKLHAAYQNKRLFSSADMFSPPSEKRPHVLRLELTQGCDYNACTYCGGYKGIDFRIKTIEEFKLHAKEVIKAIGEESENIERVFIGGGNALNARQETLVEALRFINKRLDPRRISIYGRTSSILSKGKDNLSSLRNSGLDMIYWGIESGSDQVLEYVHKGTDYMRMHDAGTIIDKTGIELSVMVMPGLGGARYLEEHALKTAKLINDISPSYVTLMTINPPASSAYSTRMSEEEAAGDNRNLSDKEIVEQIKIMIKGIKPYGGMRIGMYGCEVDPVSRNPLSFNYDFSKNGKSNILAICDNYLRRME